MEVKKGTKAKMPSGMGGSFNIKATGKKDNKGRHIFKIVSPTFEGEVFIEESRIGKDVKLTDSVKPEDKKYKCGACDGVVQDTSKYCSSCGVELQPLTDLYRVLGGAKDADGTPALEAIAKTAYKSLKSKAIDTPNLKFKEANIDMVDGEPMLVVLFVGKDGFEKEFKTVVKVVEGLGRGKLSVHETDVASGDYVVTLKAK